MNIAVIENGIVENIIVCESVEIAEEITGKTCIEYTDTDKPHIGYGFDGEEFEQPVFDDTPLVEAENGNS
jgi:hypothetical protein